MGTMFKKMMKMVYSHVGLTLLHLPLQKFGLTIAQ